jgi:SAM-dependent methyltransferase
MNSEPIVSSVFRYTDASAERAWEYRLLRCDSCGMGRLHPTPSEAALQVLYGNGYDAYRGDAAAAAGSAGRRTKLLVSELSAAALSTALLPTQRALGMLTQALEVAGGRSVPLTASVPLTLGRDAPILDFGCGAGFWLLAMRHHGYRNLSAFDVGQPALARLAQLGVHCFAGDPSVLPAAAFDCIRLEHVLEHLVDPVEALVMLRSKLTRRGTVVITVPNFASASARRLGPDWRALKLPHHLSHFTVQALQRIGLRAGFQVKRSRFLPISELALPRPREPLARIGWRFRRHAYHARSWNSPAAEYVSLELEQR